MIRSTANPQVSHNCVIKSSKILIYIIVNSAFFRLNALFCKTWMIRGILSLHDSIGQSRLTGGKFPFILSARNEQSKGGNNKLNFNPFRTSTSSARTGWSLHVTQLISYLVFLIGLISFILTFPATANAAEIKVAVAANFTTTIKKLEPVFEKQTGHDLILHFGSTGKLYAQICHGAPYDIFLAADVKRPELLETNGLAVPESRFTYANGSLVLWMPGQDAQAEFLHGKFEKIAITNPKLAPYGLAAQQFMESINVWDKYQPKILVGNTVSQTYQFVEKGGVNAGFVALSQISKEDKNSKHVWVIPTSGYTPLEQQAVLLKKAENIKLAQEFMEFLKGNQAREIIENSGYSVAKTEKEGNPQAEKGK